jgi:hypothetical protein
MVASSCSPLFVRMLACAAFALAFIPASARAAGDLPVPAAAPLMTTAHGYAVARWGMEPCGGQVAVSWTHMGSGINARSQWMSIDAHDPTTYSDCSVSYNLDVGWDWPKLCTVVEHELGHLTGHDHVNDPHDVMSPYYIYPAPECAPATTQAPPATADAAPRRAASVTSARHATAKKAAAKRKASAKRKRASERRAKSKRRPTKRRPSSSARRAKSPSPSRRTSLIAVAASISGAGFLGAPASALSLSAPDFAHAGVFGCVLADAR